MAVSGSDRITALERRVHTLEQRAVVAAPVAHPVDDPDRWWLLDRLATHAGAAFPVDSAEGEAAGSVAYGGRFTSSGGGELAWQAEHLLPAVLDADLPAAATVLAALGHPLRLEIVRRLLLGARTLADLQQIAGLGTTGQLHHHLRELRAAGLLVHGRNDYAVRPERVVPWLVIVAAATGTPAGAGGASPGSPHGQEDTT